MKNVFTGGLMVEILSVTAEQFVEPPKHGGIFEVLDERMTDFEKAAYTVMSRLRKQLESKTGNSKKESGFTLEAKELLDKFRAAKSIMYFSIQDRLNLWNTQLSVSQGFKIIIPEEETPEAIAIAIPVTNEFKEVLGNLVNLNKGETHSEKPKYWN